MPGELLTHVNGIRLRATGVGSLKSTLYSYQQVRSNLLSDLTLAITTDTQPTKLANFKSQRIQLELRTVNINEYFEISKIIILAKQVGTSYPQ